MLILAKERDCFADTSTLVISASCKQTTNLYTSEWKHYSSGANEVNVEEDHLMEMYSL